MKVIISGTTAEGKSTVARLLQAALEYNGIQTRTLNDDSTNLSIEEAERRASVVANAGTVVSIETHIPSITGRTPRELEHPSLCAKEAKVGASPYARTGFNIPEAELRLVVQAQQFVDDFYAAYPDMKALRDICKKHVDENKYIKTSFGTFKCAGAKTSRVSSSKGTKGNIPQKRK